MLQAERLGDLLAGHFSAGDIESLEQCRSQ